MIPNVYAAPGENTSPKWCEAFAAGCCGKVRTDMTLADGPVAMFGSQQLWGLLTAAQKEKRTWYYGDHGYFGKGRYYRVTRNAYQHDGSGFDSADKFKSFGIEIKPWRKTGAHILVCPPGEIFLSLMNQRKDWLDEVLRTLAKVTDRPVVIRRKHARRNRRRPLGLDLENCWALVTFMSNTSVDAILAGVPAFVLGPCAARSMGNVDLSKIENPVLSEGREQWAYNLAANQWTLDEMRANECWRKVGQC